jgi:hypothetical protein
MPTTNGRLAALHAHFLKILPRIERHARIRFRHLQCPGKRDDAVAETTAVAWKWFLRIAEQGKDVDQFVSTLADYAVRHVRSGRRLCGQEASKDAVSLARQRHHFRVQSLPTSTSHPREGGNSPPHGQRLVDAVEERLRDNSLTPVPEQAAFRLDWRAWLTTRTERDRRIIDALSWNHRTQDLARAFGISPARISRLRREYHDDWTRFTGDTPQGDDRSPATA